MICKVCGQEIESSHYINGETLEENEMCFHCDFWREMLEKDSQRAPHTWCMIDGTHYVIEPEDDPETYFRGFGGDKFVIHFNDGIIVTTTNLWCQGEPDKHWIDKFPNNATFDWEWKKIGETNYLVPKDEEIPDLVIAKEETNIGM